MVIVNYPTIKYVGIWNNTWLDNMSNNIAGVNTPKTNPAWIQGWEKIVWDINWAYSQIAVNSDNINFKVSKNDVINQINISTEWIWIQWKHIEIDWDTTVHWTFSITSIWDTWDLATKNRNDLQYEDWADITWNHTANDTNNVNGVSASTVATWWVRAYNSINSYNRYKNWLKSWELSSWSNPTTGVIIDSWWIRWYNSWTRMFEINWNNWDAYFRGNIYAVNWTFTWNINSSATITWWTFQTSTSWQRIVIDWTNNHIQFYNSSWADAWYLYWHTYNTNWYSWSIIQSSWNFGVWNSLIIQNGILMWWSILMNNGSSKIAWYADNWQLWSDAWHLYYYDWTSTHTII